MDISYAEGRIDCRCGATLRGTTPNDLAELWQGHGGQVFSGKQFENRSPAIAALPELDRMQEALDAIRELQAKCTCTYSMEHAIEGCPNYVPGDEEDGDDDE